MQTSLSGSGSAEGVDFNVDLTTGVSYVMITVESNSDEVEISDLTVEICIRKLEIRLCTCYIIAYVG